VTFPMTPTEYAFTQRGFELAAEYHQVQARIEAGHEFVALMAPGGSVFVSGEWRKIRSLTDEGSDRMTLRCADGTEWLARRTATRPYRSDFTPSDPELAAEG